MTGVLLRLYLGLATLAVAGAAYAATTEIDQIGQKFSRGSITVGVGDTLNFVNQDDVRHNIRLIDADGNEADKGLQEPGQAIDVRLDKTGRFTVRCAIHPKMKMVIEVK